MVEEERSCPDYVLKWAGQRRGGVENGGGGMKYGLFGGGV